MKYVLDLDGTLIDSNRRHYELMEKILKDMGLQQELDGLAFMRYKARGNSGKKYLTAILELEEKQADEVTLLWQQNIEKKEWIASDCLYPDTIEFLERIQKETIIFLSARQDRAVLEEELKRLGIDQYASELYVVSVKDAANRKLEVVRKLQSEEEIVIIGDSENEYKMAKELHLPVYLLNRGARSEEYWQQMNQTSYPSLLEIPLKNK